MKTWLWPEDPQPRLRIAWCVLPAPADRNQPNGSAQICSCEKGWRYVDEVNAALDDLHRH